MTDKKWTSKKPRTRKGEKLEGEKEREEEEWMTSPCIYVTIKQEAASLMLSSSLSQDECHLTAWSDVNQAKPGDDDG